MKVSELDACECWYCGRDIDRDILIERHGEEIPEGVVLICDDCASDQQ